MSNQQRKTVAARKRIATAEMIREAMADHLTYSISKYSEMATTRDWCEIAARTTRDRMVERWMETMQTYYQHDPKRVYYLSLEFLVGRTFSNAVLNLELHDEFKNALYELGLDIEQVAEMEFDAGLGNGGLGRLAACFLDSMATLELPCYG